MGICRICGSNKLTLKLDLGLHPPSDNFLSDLSEPETFYPLQLFLCKQCGLVQLGYTVDRKILFNDNYPYETGVNKDGVKHFKELALTVYNKFKPKFVVDIGSNDGTLLKGFEYLGAEVLGVEPVRSIADKAKVKTQCAFWDSDIRISHKADVITATNVLAHSDDLHGFMKGVDKCLAKDGIFVVEAPYLYDMLNGFEYDTIYHEHLCYFSPYPLEILFKMHGMTIFHMERLPHIHGGTMRYYVSRREPTTTIAKENFTEELLDDFEEGVIRNKNELLKLLWELKLKGNSIVGISAPAKGNTLLNYCNIGPELLDNIAEKSTRKIGKYTPGSHIRVISDDDMLEDIPEYGLLLAWNWSDQIKKSLKGFRGKFIIPIPWVNIEER